MSSIADIASALFARCATIDTGSPALPVAYPEVSFAPPANGKYLVVSLFPNRPAAECLTSGRVDQGLLQVTVVWPKNAGLIAPSGIAQAVIDHFPNGLPLYSGSTRVKISGASWAAAPISDTDRVSIAITIPWIA